MVFPPFWFSAQMQKEKNWLMAWLPTLDSWIWSKRASALWCPEMFRWFCCQRQFRRKMHVSDAELVKAILSHFFIFLFILKNDWTKATQICSVWLQPIFPVGYLWHVTRCFQWATWQTHLEHAEEPSRILWTTQIRLEASRWLRGTNVKSSEGTNRRQEMFDIFNRNCTQSFLKSTFVIR